MSSNNFQTGHCEDCLMYKREVASLKGDGCKYRPSAGTTCLISGPNCDNDEGYTYIEVEVLWTDEIFVVYRKPGCWPVVRKWEHIRSKPIEQIDG